MGIRVVTHRPWSLPDPDPAPRHRLAPWDPEDVLFEPRGVSRQHPSIADRIEAGDCWMWTGATDPGTMRGRLKDQGRDLPAHVFLWEVLVGVTVPKGMILVEQCQRGCVNPDHMVLLERQIWRKRRRRWPRCEHGYLVYQPSGWSQCHICPLNG